MRTSDKERTYMSSTHVTPPVSSTQKPLVFTRVKRLTSGGNVSVGTVAELYRPTRLEEILLHVKHNNVLLCEGGGWITRLQSYYTEDEGATHCVRTQNSVYELMP